MILALNIPVFISTFGNIQTRCVINHAIVYFPFLGIHIDVVSIFGLHKIFHLPSRFRSFEKEEDDNSFCFLPWLFLSSFSFHYPLLLPLLLFLFVLFIFSFFFPFSPSYIFLVIFFFFFVASFSFLPLHLCLHLSFIFRAIKTFFIFLVNNQLSFLKCHFYKKQFYIALIL